MITIGERLKTAREQMNMSQSKLSKLAGISHSTISLIERGKKIPSRKTLDKLEVVLGISKPPTHTTVVPDWAYINLDTYHNVYLGGGNLDEILAEIKEKGYTSISAYSPEEIGGWVIRAIPHERKTDYR